MSIRKILSSDHNIMTAAAIFVSFCALAVSVYQSVILRNQQYASVWPYIEPGVQYSNHTFQLNIQNKGTGPAIIKSIHLELDGSPVTDYKDFMEKLLKEKRFQSMSIAPIQNSVISANGSVQMLAAELPDSLLIKSADFPQRTKIVICYCSIFGDCWNFIDGEVTKCKECK
ncbi:MAG: hypothetical protein ABI761_14180 [Saprospiraceae bacterium]